MCMSHQSMKGGLPLQTTNAYYKKTVDVFTNELTLASVYLQMHSDVAFCGCPPLCLVCVVGGVVW